MHENKIFEELILHENKNFTAVILHENKIFADWFYSITFQSKSPLPISSNSMARPTTFRLSALNGSR